MGTTAGTCTVTVDQSGGTNYNAAAQVSQSFTVTPPQQTTTLSVATASGTYGGSVDLSATLTAGTTPVGGEIVNFSVNGTQVCGGTLPSLCPMTDPITGIVTLAGVSLSEIKAGTYTNGVTASFAGDSGYTASNGVNTLTVNPATVTFTLSSLNQTYSGSARSVTVASTPAGVTPSVTYTGTNGTTYTTSTTAPTDAGSYTVAVTSANPNYTGSQTGTLVVAKANQTITVTTAAPSSKAYNGTFTVAANTDSGLSVTYGSNGGCSNNRAGYTMTSGSTACTVTFDQSGNANYNAATQVIETVTATKASATIDLSNLNRTYDGGAKAATATTTPIGLSGVTITYAEGSTAVSAPTDAGSYSVHASLSNPNYTASEVTGTLVIAKAPQSISFSLSTLPAKTYGNTSFDISSYGSGGGSSNAVTFSSATASVCTVSGSTVTIVAAGTCTINVDEAGSSNYLPAPQVQGSVTISKATLAVTPPSGRSVQYSDALPSLTPAITGYVLGQNASVLTSSPTSFPDRSLMAPRYPDSLRSLRPFASVRGHPLSVVETRSPRSSSGRHREPIDGGQPRTTANPTTVNS